MSDIILDILRRYVDGTKIKKASARSGGEYHSPCPKCGGTDRFCVFPEQPGGALAMQHGITGTWACPRHCQEGGDAIDLLTENGLKYEIKRVYSDTDEKDRVVRQSEAANSKVAKDTIVTLEVSDGPEPTEAPTEAPTTAPTEPEPTTESSESGD